VLIPKSPPLRDKAFLLSLRETPCVFTRSTEVEASHIRKGTNTGGGAKPHDFYCLPLHYELHRELHRVGEITFYQERIKEDPHVMMEMVLAYSKLRYMKWLAENGRKDEVLHVLFA
jgi:hypothetical protein